MSELGRLYGLSGQYERAIAIYQDMAYSALESRSATNIRILLRQSITNVPLCRLLRYCADEYLFRCSLCHLAVDW